MVKYTYTINKKGIIMKREFAVIGLGRFGGSICEELSIEGMDVLAIDINQQKINEFKNIASHAVIADSTDESVLKDLGINNIDHVIVAIGDRSEEHTSELQSRGHLVCSL